MFGRNKRHNRDITRERIITKESKIVNGIIIFLIIVVIILII